MISAPKKTTDTLKRKLNTKRRRPSALPLSTGYTPPIPIYKHQRTAIELAVRKQALGVFDDPGMGKTLQGVLIADCITTAMREAERIFILCKSAHAGVWVQHFADYAPHLRVQSVVGKSADKRKWHRRTNVHIINYELLQRAAGKGAPLTQFPNGTYLRLNEDAARVIRIATKHGPSVMLADESHYFKTPTSNITKFMMAASCAFTRRYIFTGTPVAERPEDVWSQLYVLDQGKTLGRSYAAFKNRYCIMRDTQYGPKVCGHRHKRELHCKLKSVSVRRLKKNCLDLPAKVPKVTNVQRTAEHEGFMRSARDTLLQALHQYKGNTIYTRKGTSVAAALTAYRKVCAMPSTVHPTTVRGSKYHALVDIMQQESAPIVVWCDHVSVVQEVARALTEDGYRVATVYGKIKHKVRDTIVHDFEHGAYDWLIATQSAMREAVTITNSQHAIYFEFSWQLLNWTQSQDRLHRIGQKGTVVINRMFLDGSLDAYMYDVLCEKERSASEINDGKRYPAVLSKQRLLECLAW